MSCCRSKRQDADAGRVIVEDSFKTATLPIHPDYRMPSRSHASARSMSDDWMNGDVETQIGLL